MKSRHSKVTFKAWYNRGSDYYRCDGLPEKIAEQIKQQGGDNVFSLKGHHGRIETHTIRATGDIAWLQEQRNWTVHTALPQPLLKEESITKLLKKREWSEAVRARGANALDDWKQSSLGSWIAFDRDSKGHGAANPAVIRHIGLNQKTSKVDVKIKRLKAGWDNNHLLPVIGMI